MLLHLLCILSCHHFSCMVTPEDGWRVSTCPGGTKRRLTWSKAGLQCHDLSPPLYHQTTACTQINEKKVREKKHDSSCLKWKKAKLKGHFFTIIVSRRLKTIRQDRNITLSLSQLTYFFKWLQKVASSKLHLAQPYFELNAILYWLC